MDRMVTALLDAYGNANAEVSINIHSLRWTDYTDEDFIKELLMQEIRFHGRGGQGAVIGSEILAHAFLRKVKCAAFRRLVWSVEALRNCLLSD